MKSSINPKPFVPVSITLTFENQMELDVFASIINTVPIADTFEKLSASPRYMLLKNVTPNLEACGANPSAYVSQICDEIAAHFSIKNRNR